MISISERLRARQEPVGDGTGRWRKDGLCQEAAEIIDELVEALEIASDWVESVKSGRIVDAALAKAKGKQE